MNIEKILRKKFKINKAYFEKEGKIFFLRIEVDEPDLTKLTKLSKNISEFLDDNELLEEKYFLDIFSSGTEKEISLLDIKMGDHIKVSLKKNIDGKKTFEGYVVNTNPKTIKYNTKGRFRNLNIEKYDIEKINMSAKIEKEK